jgi:hypothetical protein
MGRLARDRRSLLVALLLAAAALLVLAPVFALAMAPALAAFALVTQRIMPGEDRLVAILARNRPRRRPAAAIPPHGHRAVVVHRAGRRLASALAMRPPPSAPLALQL